MDHLYLYRMEENDMQPECLVEDVVKELYVLGDWVYFTNLFRHTGLYRVKTDGSGLEAVCEEPIDRFLPFRGAFYCLFEWEEGTNRVFVCTVDGEIKTLFEGKCYWISTDGELFRYETYYCLTKEGLDVFFVEDLRTFKEYHFIISYEELEDIWISPAVICQVKIETFLQTFSYHLQKKRVTLTSPAIAAF